MFSAKWEKKRIQNLIFGQQYHEVGQAQNYKALVEYELRYLVFFCDR